MYSMTGFGKKELSADGRRIRVEIKSVNNRFLDQNIRMPRFLMFLEDDVRKTVQSRIARGRIDLFVNYFSERDDAKKLTVNNVLISAYYNAAKSLSEKYDIDGNISSADLLKIPDAVSFEDDETDEQALRSLISEALNGAIDELLAARKTEGSKLMRDVYSRLDLLEDYVGSIESFENQVVTDYRDRLRERINILLEGQTPVDESRLAQEVAIFADRCNITEETVRIRSHIARFRQAEKEQSPQGRNLDFIVQELNREFNTIGSKANFVDITNYVISAKGEIEKIREQIQNIE